MVILLLVLLCMDNPFTFSFILISNPANKPLTHKLTAKGVVADWREPNVIRLSPVPLYNSFKQVFEAAQILSRSVQEIAL